MKPLYILALFSLSLLFSCTKDEIKIDPDNLLIGTWNYSGFNENINVYARSADFTDTYGYRFNADGSMVQRSISGWCATPPVVYENYNGTWDIINDTLIKVRVEYWGGIRDYSLGISLLDRDSLKIVEIAVK